MKLSSTLLAALAPAASSAAECGKWYSSPCVCDSDIKYCPEGERDGATDNIIDQHPFWKDYEGFYEVKRQGMPTEANPTDEEPNTRWIGSVGFLNVTIDGSRLYSHMYSIVVANPDVDCEADNLSGGQPACFSECGFGCATLIEGYGTGTPERDGSLATSFKLQPSLDVPVPGMDLEIGVDGEYKQVPVDDMTLFGTAISGVFKVTQTFTFIDQDKKQASAIEDVYMTVRDKAYLVSQSRDTYTRLDNAEEFVKATEAGYVEHRVRDSKKPAVPPTSSCGQPEESCPTEEDFCELDPRCNPVKKYEEPDATLKAGPIAGIVVACFVVLIAGLFALHLQKMKEQAARNQAVFARRIAETIKLEGPDRALTPEALAAEFKKIDNGNVDGSIDKDELWNFINSGKVAKMNKSDFNALFAALDTDGDGTVSFMEFSAYMGKAYGEFDKMKGSASVRAARGDAMDKYYAGVSKRILEVEPAEPVEPMDKIKEEEKDEENQ